MFRVSQVTRTVRLGVKNLLLHAGRSILTMLGIIFGVCSVIAMLAIGEGASHEAQEAIRRLGSTNIILQSVKPPEDRQASSQATSFAVEYGLSYKDAYRILETVPGVETVLPSRIMRTDVEFGVAKQQVQVIGTLAAYPNVMNLELESGRFITDHDQQHKANVCVLSAGLVDRIFPYQNPLEEAVRIDGVYYRVVGVLGLPVGHRANAGAGRAEWDNRVYIPLATASEMFGETVVNRTSGSMSAETVELHEVVVRTYEPAQVETAALVIAPLLAKFHTKVDYEMVVPMRLLQQAEETKRMFNIVLGSIAAISLVVGGIGIMNIMMATVTERTREIGIRRALGARKRDIVLQFLVETLVLSVGGGLIGVVVGIQIPLLVSRMTDMPTIITTWSLILSFGISGLVGLVFGIYPASRAANLDPIEALRHE